MTDNTISAPAKFRDVAGALIAFSVVMAYVAVGFAIILVKVVSGVDVAPQEAWMAGLSSLASAGLGYLIGRNDMPTPAPPTPPPLPYVASGCNNPACPINGSNGPTHESS